MRRLSDLCIVLAVTGAVLAPPAHAFTFEDGNKGSSSIPKFDLEEQARQFRTPSLDTSATGKREIDTPLGKLQFDVRQNDTMFGYGSLLTPGFGANGGNADRRHYERMFTPGYIQGRGD